MWETGPHVYRRVPEHEYRRGRSKPCNENHVQYCSATGLIFPVCRQTSSIATVRAFVFACILPVLYRTTMVRIVMRVRAKFTWGGRVGQAPTRLAMRPEKGHRAVLSHSSHLGAPLPKPRRSLPKTRPSRPYNSLYRNRLPLRVFWGLWSRY